MAKLTRNQDEIERTHRGARLELADLQPIEDRLAEVERSDEEIETYQRMRVTLEQMVKDEAPRMIEARTWRLRSYAEPDKADA